MDAVELYNKLQRLIKLYEHFNLLSSLTISDIVKTQEIALKLKTISILLSDGSFDLKDCKLAIDELFRDVNLEKDSRKHFFELESTVKTLRMQMDNLILEISNSPLEEKEVGNLVSNEDKLEVCYYNYCIRRLKEYLNNYKSHKTLKYDYLNDKLKIELGKEVFISNKPRVRKE